MVRINRLNIIFQFYFLEIFYAGESIPRRTVVSLTCPHCGIAGFIPRTLLTHCVEKHSSISLQDKNSQVVVCKTFIFSHKKKIYHYLFLRKKFFLK
jgi:hypothetical protein